MPPFYRAPEYPFAQSLQAMMQAREQQRARKEQQENNVVGGLQTLANVMYKNKSEASAADAEARKLVAKEMLSNLLAGKMTTQRPSPVDVNPGAMRSPLDLNTSQVNVGSPQPYTMSNEDYINVVRTGSLPKDVTAVPTAGENELVDIPIWGISPKGDYKLEGTFKGKPGSRPIIRKQGQSIEDVLSEIQTLGGAGAVPPGTTVHAGGISMQVNPKMTEEQYKNVAEYSKFKNITTSLRGMVESNPNLTDGVTGSITTGAANRLPYFATAAGSKFNILPKETGEYQRLLKQLGVTAFAFGGKQLTDTEAKRVDYLMPREGKTKEQTMRDLDELDKFFKLKAEAPLGGREKAMSMLSNIESPNRDTSNPATWQSGQEVMGGQFIGWEDEEGQ